MNDEVSSWSAAKSRLFSKVKTVKRTKSLLELDEIELTGQEKFFCTVTSLFRHWAQRFGMEHHVPSEEARFFEEQTEVLARTILSTHADVCLKAGSSGSLTSLEQSVGLSVKLPGVVEILWRMQATIEAEIFPDALAAISDEKTAEAG